MCLDENYWSGRYQSHDTPWDVAQITTPLKEYFDQLEDKSLKIMIPGAGYGHEVAYLYANGFTNVFMADISKAPLEDFEKRNPDFPSHQLLHVDFFQHEDKYDLIIEQTFFCALDPSLRQRYADQCHKLLKPGGKVVGLLFHGEFSTNPPYGGTMEEYLEHFQAFDKQVFEPCYNSIPARAGRELFFSIVKSGYLTTHND
ncbi:methyltransferase [Fulvivirga ligni]|uniref:methyltransferase n=1 Tax=Fulvivirga ligni TaxID=2904246 RepID=UPI001F27E48E|nr:methyltransferase [Fulvivirga ligni]UII24114.1 TPMT family class I SAM-dependent methyltransferase [Fulvivirga ligni]